MSARRNHRRKGNAIVEFSLAGIAAIASLLATFHLCLIMWNYHTLANAVTAGAQLASVRGRGCTENGNACSVTVGDIARHIAGEAPGVPPGRFRVTLTTASGQNHVCNPLSSCLSDASVWPPSASNDNAPGAAITVTAHYPAPYPLIMLWPGTSSVEAGVYSLPVSSTQRIVF